MVSLDIENAYFSVSIRKDYKQFLRFEVDNEFYEFNVQPFGLCTAPYAFTKLLKPVLHVLRENNIRVVVYDI